jgi:hypothetical protein
MFSSTFLTLALALLAAASPIQKRDAATVEVIMTSCGLLRADTDDTIG